MADGHFLGRRDLHMVDEIAVPHRLEDAIGEAQHQQVLHGLLAQIMVNAIHLIFGKDLVDLRVERRAVSRLLPKGFSMTTRRGPCSWAARPATPRLAITDS